MEQLTYFNEISIANTKSTGNLRFLTRVNSTFYILNEFRLDFVVLLN